MNNKGYTLTELMMYLVLSTAIIGFSLSLVRHSSISFINTRRIEKAQLNGRSAITIMVRDIINTGFKSYMAKVTTTPPDTFKVITVTESTITNESGPDSLSSFIAKNGSPYDTLTIYKIALNNSNTYKQTEKIKFFVIDSSKELVRNKFVLDNTTHTWADSGIVTLTRNIEALQFQFSSDMSVWKNCNELDSIKTNMKYIKCFLLIKTDKQTKTIVNKTFNLADLTLSYTDNYIRRIFTETIPILNNGLF